MSQTIKNKIDLSIQFELNEIKKKCCDGIFDENTATIAAENGHLNCLKLSIEKKCFIDDMTCAFAALNGHLDCLQYLYSIGCDWDAKTCSYAAENGHLHVLESQRIRFEFPHIIQIGSVSTKYSRRVFLSNLPSAVPLSIKILQSKQVNVFNLP